MSTNFSESDLNFINSDISSVSSVSQDTSTTSVYEATDGTTFVSHTDYDNMTCTITEHK